MRSKLPSSQIWWSIDPWRKLSPVLAFTTQQCNVKHTTQPSINQLDWWPAFSVFLQNTCRCKPPQTPLILLFDGWIAERTILTRRQICFCLQLQWVGRRWWRWQFCRLYGCLLWCYLWISPFCRQSRLRLIVKIKTPTPISPVLIKSLSLIS